MARKLNEHRFTDEQIEAAENVNVLDYIQREGYTLQKHGIRHYRLKEMDSLVIDPGKNRWKRYSENVGGNAISFAVHIQKLTYPEAVKRLLEIYQPELLPAEPDKREIKQRVSVWKKIEEAKKLLGMNSGLPEKESLVIEKPTVSRKEKAPDTPVPMQEIPEPVTFAVPARNINNNRVLAYLCQKRRIDNKIVFDCIKKKTLFEDAEHHNCVFVGYDAENNAKYAGLKGTLTKEGQKEFRGEVLGSNKAFSWSYTPEGTIETLFVYESPIDAMSHMSLHMLDGKDYKVAHRLSLGCLADVAVERYLADHPEIKKIAFCLDNDKWGQQATVEYMKKYTEKGYECAALPPKNKEVKDYNDLLKKNKIKSKENER
jgi:hypothetical protein